MRTREGIAVAKAKGITLGSARSRVPDEVLRRIRDLVEQGTTLAKIPNDLTDDRVPLPYGRQGRLAGHTGPAR